MRRSDPAAAAISIVIPAHNEETGIRRSLDSLLADAAPGEFEIVVVCNGCNDATAEVVRSFGPAVHVIETDIPSKSNALNLGDGAARGFPRIYMDADVILSTQSARRLAAPLADGRALAAAPAVDTVFKPDAAWAVRAYYRFWMALPFVQEGMMAAGVYAVSAAGRARFGAFPDVISDDGFFRLHFANGERIEVADAISQVIAPSAWADLIRIKTRSRVGIYQLDARYSDLYTTELQSKRYGRALMSIVAQPSLYLAAIPFLIVSIVSRLRARRQFQAAAPYVWERDHSSRALSPGEL